MTYSRDNVEWLYLYYSGEHLDYIGNHLGRSRRAVKNRISSMKLPMRPKGQFCGDIKINWLNQPHIKALRLLFKGMGK